MGCALADGFGGHPPPDGIYGPAVNLVRSTGTSRARKIGNQVQVLVQIAQVPASAELLPIVPKMKLSVAQARKAARNIVAGKLALLDELTRRLLGPAPRNPRRQKAADPQGDLL